jgi:hypothetical protein
MAQARFGADHSTTPKFSAPCCRNGIQQPLHFEFPCILTNPARYDSDAGFTGKKSTEESLLG